MMRLIVIIMLVALTTACSMGSSGSARPTLPPFMPGPPKGGPPEFQEGWLDGCESGVASHGADIYRSTFKFKQNPSLIMNPIYYKAWKDAQNFCLTYIFTYSFRNMEVGCFVDGLTNDCGDTTTNNVPGFGQSTNSAGYAIFGGGGVDSLMGGGDNAPGMGGNEDGISGVMGNW